MNDPHHHARISFSEQRIDAQGQTRLGRPVEIAQVPLTEPAPNGQGIDWHVDPKHLGDGVYYYLDPRQQNGTTEQAPDASEHGKSRPSHYLTFSEYKTNEHGQRYEGTPIDVAVVWPRKNGKQGGILDWNLKPQHLGEGIYRLHERERTQQHQQDAGQRRDAFAQVDQSRQNRDQGLSR